MNRSAKIGIGLLGGIGANCFGIIIGMLLFTDNDIISGLLLAYEAEFLGKIIGLGAIVNMLLFSYFIKKNKIEYARGVVFATLISAFITLYLSF